MPTTEKMIKQVLELREKGLSREDIAKELHLSEETVGWLLSRGKGSEKPPADIYIGWRSVGVYSSRLTHMARIFSDIILEECARNETEVDAIMGIAINGIPLATTIANEMDLELIVYRPRRGDDTSEGMGSILSNYAGVRDKRIAIVDDVLSTGNTMKNAIEFLKANQGEPTLCLSIVNKQNFDQIEGVPVRALIRTHVV
ncbi:MAG: orotate phosphoribosyltransferase-like protein [Candidatus Thermoplasmatota archaeon]|nr:orotate phosphoribosyltransferase-like protein [Candidatus Thermoplasmatota archaeon]